ncbi:MAG TPA: TetR family transcriptional regulator [Candidatus Limnocylindrales bacterium]|nr:TetR family transcriptional regulator [Candidatus Limnocylindrales bacterium]
MSGARGTDEVHAGAEHGVARGGRGRRPGAGDTRARILDAARAAFGERGFEGASVRDIAARAGVDPALVHHYFGTKQRLFIAAMRFPVDVNEVVPRLLAGGGPGVGERFVRFVVELWDRPEIRPMLLGVVRSASTDEVAAAMMREVLAEGPLLALAAAVPGEDARTRAALAGSQLIGLVLARYIIRVEPLASMTPDEIAAAIGPAVERYLFDA